MLTLSYYAIIGAIFTLGIDLFMKSNFYKKHTTDKNVELKHTDKIICIIIWPACLSVFLFYFFKSWFNYCTKSK